MREMIRFPPGMNDSIAPATPEIKPIINVITKRIPILQRIEL